jgi:hypothetical protein
MANIQTRYPQASADTVALTITLASLASTASGVLLAGRESTAVDNTTNLDLDHLLSGKIRVGTSPTASRVIEVWAYAPISIASGTPEYPDVLDGTDSDETMTSANVKASALRLVWSTLTDNTTDRDYFIPPTSIASLFGDLPPYWGVFVTHDTGVALNATGSNHFLHYQRFQRQSV